MNSVRLIVMRSNWRRTCKHFWWGGGIYIHTHTHIHRTCDRL